MSTIDLTYQSFYGQKGEKIMSTNDPKEPKKVNLVQQAEEGAASTSDCCGGGGNSNDDCCGDGGDSSENDCCG
jgi:hypothetical protein